MKRRILPSNMDLFFVSLRIVVMAFFIVGLHLIYWNLGGNDDH